MANWLLTFLFSLCICFFLKYLFTLFFSGEPRRLPPGPSTISLIGKFLRPKRSVHFESILRDFKSKYGPLFSLRLGSRPVIFIADHSLAHFALVQNGAVFSDRPVTAPAARVLNSNQRNVSSAAYGPTWRLLRRNLTSGIFNPSRVRSYSKSRQWVLGILFKQLLSDNSESGLKIIDHFQYAMFCLLVVMCFGDKLEEHQIKQIQDSQRKIILSVARFSILMNIWPNLGRILFRNRSKEVMQLALDRENTLTPFIKARIEVKERVKMEEKDEDDEVLAYVDTLVNLELPDEKRKLNYGEMATLCGEFLNAGTDTTSTALQWIMANLIKYPSLQAKLYDEMLGVIGNREQRIISEEDLQTMPFLKAVVLEGLRRHPPSHFVLPHTVTEEVELEGYVVPKNAVVNFMVADIGWDPKVWEDPMEFKPERFLCNNGGEVIDISGSREIKMMPFGAGRRICPGLALALLHLEYFVANLVWCFEWKVVEGDDVDLTEKLEFTTVMKNPLRARLFPRNELI